MELSSVVHYMNESFAFKLGDHQYLIKLRTKRDDIKKVSLKYVEKYLRERNVKDHPTFTKEMKKVASTSLYDYYEVVISDEFEFFNQKVNMIAVRYYFILEGKDGEIVFYGNYKYETQC